MTNTETPAEVATVVDAYIASWNEADATARTDLVALAWAADARYVDPLLEANGHAELAGMAPQLHAMYPGAVIRRQSGVDVHHDQVRFAWDLANPDGTVVVAGLDVGQIDADGRLRSITGFFGDVPAA